MYYKNNMFEQPRKIEKKQPTSFERLTKALMLSGLLLGAGTEAAFGKEKRAESLSAKTSKVESIVTKNPDRTMKKYVNGQSIGNAYEKEFRLKTEDTSKNITVESEKRGIFIQTVNHEETERGIETKTKFYFDEGKDGKVDALIIVDGVVKSKAQTELLKLDLTERDLKTLQDQAEMSQINPNRSTADKRMVLFFDHENKKASLVDYDNGSAQTINNQKAEALIQKAQALYGDTMADVIKSKN